MWSQSLLVLGCVYRWLSDFVATFIVPTQSFISLKCIIVVVHHSLVYCDSLWKPPKPPPSIENSSLDDDRHNNHTKRQTSIFIYKNIVPQDSIRLMSLQSLQSYYCFLFFCCCWMVPGGL